LKVTKGASPVALATLPPGPKGHYLIGNLLDYARDPLGFMSRCSKEYGDIVRLRFPGLPLYLLTHPDYAEHVLLKHNRGFVKSRYFRRELSFLGKGLLTSEGEFWRRQRRLAQPAFHRQRVNAYGEVMVSYAQRMLATWQDGETHDIYQEMTRLTLQIVAKTLFDAGVDKTEKVGEVLGWLGQHTKQLDEQGSGMVLRFLLGNFPTPSNLRFRQGVGRLDEVIYDLIWERRSSGKDTGDLLSMLLRAGAKEGNGMNDKQLRDEVITLLLAGHETTALTLSWTWYLLAQHPGVEAKLLRELQEVLGDREPTVEDLPRLRYAELVIKESMRLYPPAWGISREAKEECEIRGYGVPAGTQLLIVSWAMHRDPRYFERPEAFDPERWEDGSVKGVPKYAYLPFGAGPRLCIGSSFAMTEATLLLATIAKKFQLKLAPEQQRVVPQPSTTLRPRGGMRMVLSKRHPSV
jgi:cytochrome P450